jgi:hypothetical protein
MAANCPQQVATVDEIGQPMTEEGLGSVVLDRLGQLLCGMQGHEHMLQSAEGRLFLRCVTCGHESPGWDVPTRVRAAKISEARARVAPPRARRVA